LKNIVKKDTDLVVFDLDGTLIDSSPDIAWAVNRTLEGLGREPLETRTIRANVGWGTGALFERLMPDADAALVERARCGFLETYGSRLSVETLVYPGVVETLEAFTADGRLLAVVSNKPEALSVSVIAELGLSGFFTMVLGGDSLPEKKPHPAPILKVLDETGIRAERAAMVGDSPIDCRAGRESGLFTVGVTYGFRPRSEIDSAGFDAVIERFPELTDLLPRP